MLMGSGGGYAWHGRIYGKKGSGGCVPDAKKYVFMFDTLNMFSS